MNWEKEKEELIPLTPLKFREEETVLTVVFPINILLLSKIVAEDLPEELKDCLVTTYFVLGTREMLFSDFIPLQETIKLIEIYGK